MVSAPDTVVVECYSGHKFAERPMAVVWEGRRYQIERISKQWRSQEGPGFRVVTADGARFDLTYNEIRDKWSLHLVTGEQKRLKSHASREGASAEASHSSDPDRKENEPDA